MEDSNETTTEKKGSETPLFIFMSIFIFIFTGIPIMVMMYLAYKDYMKPKQETTVNINPETSTVKKQNPNLGYIPVPTGEPINPQDKKAYQAIETRKLQQAQRQRKRLEQIRAAELHLDEVSKS